MGRSTNCEKRSDSRAEAAEINALLQQARDEDVLVRTEDGTEFLLTAVDEFDQEIARTRQNAKLMAMLDERAKQGREHSARRG